MMRPSIRMPRKRYLMRSDVRETENMYVLEIDLPGFSKDNIKAHVENGYLCVEASEAKEVDDNKKEPKTYISKERYEGAYKRTFFIGTDVKQEDIKASYKHGVLRLNIPKKPVTNKEQSHAIQIA